MDPGIKNFAYSVIELDDTSLEWSVLQVGYVEKPLTKMTLLLDEVDTFIFQIEGLFNVWHPDMVAVERFLNRGRIHQALNEVVNVGIGLIFSTALRMGAKIGIPTSGVWKNTVNRNIKIGDCYNATRKLIREGLTHYNPHKQPIVERRVQRIGRYLIRTKKVVKSRRRTSDLSKNLQNMVPHTTDATLIALFHMMQELKLTRQAKVVLSAKVIETQLSTALLRQGGRDV
jgi:Holliday junction resolvasome RuvABC endonuclease subunit